MQAQISPQVFYSHVEKLRKTWANKYVDELDSIILINGKATNGNQKTVAIVSWLFAAYNLTDTIICFNQKEIIIYASQRKINFLNNIKKHSNADKFNLKFIQKTQNSQESFNNIWQQLHQQKNNPRIGMFVKDDKVGQVAEDFNKFLNQKTYTPEDIFSFFNECFISKDSDEIQNLKKSSLVSCYFLQKFIKQIQKVIDQGTTVKHHQIAGKVQDLLSNESELKKCAIKITNSQSNLAFSKEYIDIGPSINVQSGGNYSPKLFATPNSSTLKSDCILASLGTLYKSYNSYAGRTLLINPTDEQKSYYKKCLAIMKVILQNLRPGITLSSVYKKVVEFMKSYLPNVQPPKSFGFGIGVFLCQNSLQISENNSKLIQEGSSFLINCTLTGLKYNTKKGEKQFAIQIIQTVIITEKGQDILTSGVSTSLSDISYQFDEEDEGTKTKSKNPNIISYENVEGKPVTRRGAKYQVTVQKLKNQKKRNDHQMQLKYKKLEQLKERVNENFIGGFKKQKNIDCSRLESYKAREDFPKEMKKNQIYVDNKNHTILLPINGRHIPFHIHTLKSVVKNDEGKFASLRFNFLLPGTISNLTFPKFNETSVYVKQMVFRSQQVARITQLQKQIKALQKKVRLDISEKHAKEDIVEQQVLKMNKGKRPILRDLFARPYIGTKRIKGILECHINGFRYTSGKEQIDVTFSNIKHAFFQPCEKQIIAAIHFRLHEPIMIGKKKTDDVQFYSEGGPNTEDVGGRGRGGMDEDSEDEERQKQARRRLDKQFQHWIKSCEEFKGKSFEFEYPSRNGGFYGNHSKHNSLFQPTKNCLINVTQTPFFICALDEIEVICYERMYANSKTFDLIIVMKDYQNHLKINAIPIKDVEKVKDWLNSCNIIFYQQGKSLNWIKFLGNIRKDFKKFVDDGGWMAWDEADQQQEMRDQQDDVSYEASESDMEESEDSDDESSHYQDEDEDDDSDEDDSSSLSQEGLDSDEMQERAELEDRERERREREKQREKMRKKR